jgi:hypothetical protein
MPEYAKQRQVPRIVIPARPVARARTSLDVHLCDLSTKGARIEHLNLLRPGFHCALELPPPFGPLVLAAQVAWSRIIGAEEGADGERRLRYQSGLAFTEIMADQQAVLGKVLEQIIPAGGIGVIRLALD